MMVLEEVITGSEDDMLFWGREKTKRARITTQTNQCIMGTTRLIGQNISCDLFRSTQEKTGKCFEICKYVKEYL